MRVWADTPRTIVFVHGGHEEAGGALAAMLDLVRGVDRARFAPIIVVTEPHPELLDADVPMHVLVPRPDDGPVTAGSALMRALMRTVQLFTVVAPRARELRSLFARTQPALVYLADGLGTNLAAVLAAAGGGAPSVCRLRAFLRVGLLDRLLSRRVAVAVARTDAVAAQQRARGLRAQRFVTVHDGVDVARFTTGRGAAVRREFAIEPHVPVIGVVGAIREETGQLMVAEAIARVRHRVPDLHALVVGPVHPQDDAYAEQLRERIHDPDLLGHVHLAGARSDPDAYLDAMDIVVHAAPDRPFGRALVEAMAARRPVVAPRVDGMGEIVVDGETGLLVPPRDPDALAEAVLTLVRDATLRETLGQAARTRAAVLFDLRGHVRAMEELFDELLGSAPVLVAGAAA